jgi:hypothetical protein
MVSIVDMNAIHDPSTGTIPPASWGDAIWTNIQTLATRPAASVKASVAQAVTTGATGEALLADVENYDSDTMHSGTQARLTATTGGLWLATATIQFANNTTGNRGISFRIDGSTILESGFVPASGGTNSTVLSTSRFLALTAAQYVETRAVHNSGSDLDVTLLDFSMVLLNF